MKLKQIAISIENSPRRLFEVTNALGEAGINMRALTLVETGGGFGLLRLLVSDVASTRRILMQNHVPAQVNEVVAVEIEDKPGSLAKVLKNLQAAKVHVIYMYTFVRFSSGNAVNIFRFSDNNKAVKILEEKGIKLLDAKAFGILETQGNN